MYIGMQKLEKLLRLTARLVEVDWIERDDPLLTVRCSAPVTPSDYLLHNMSRVMDAAHVKERCSVAQDER